MIQVELQDNGLYLDVSFKYHRDYIDRIRRIPGRHFSEERKVWEIPVGAFDELEEEFDGELVFITPRHKILGEPAPPPPDWYFKIPKNEIKLKLSPYPFQKFGANFLAHRAKEKRFALLCDDMGLGKTPQGIGAAQELIKEGLVKNVLIVCLSNLKQQWAKEGILKFTDESAIVIDGNAKKRKKLYAESRDNDIRYTIMNYELLLRDLDEVKGKFDLVIYDEAHRIKNRLGKMNNAAMELKPTYQFFLTGTPLMNRPDELFGIFQVADPDIFGKYSKFKKKYIKFGYNGQWNDMIGYKNLHLLRDEVGQYILRRTEEEVSVDLPKMVIQDYYVDATELQKELIKKIDIEQGNMIERALGLAKKGKRDEAQALLKAAQSMLALKLGASDSPELFTMSKSAKVKEKYGAMVKGVKTSPKLDLCKELVEEIINSGHKVVIFTQFERMAQILDRELKKYAKTAVYTGQMSSNTKEVNKEAFRNEQDVKILIATEAGSTGLNLQVAKYLINYDLPWNPATYNQRNGRIRRLYSAHKRVFVYNLLTNDTLDQSVQNAIKNKKNLFNALVGNDESTTQILKELMEG